MTASEPNRVSVDIVRLASIMRQGDKSVKWLCKSSGAIMDNRELDSLKRGLSETSLERMMRDYIPIPKTDARTVFRWMREWIATDAARITSDTAFVDELQDNLNGEGAFGKFKNALSAPGRELYNQSWDRFRHKALCERARQWLSQMRIEFNELSS